MNPEIPVTSHRERLILTQRPLRVKQLFEALFGHSKTQASSLLQFPYVDKDSMITPRKKEKKGGTMLLIAWTWKSHRPLLLTVHWPESITGPNLPARGAGTQWKPLDIMCTNDLCDMSHLSFASYLNFE